MKEYTGDRVLNSPDPGEAYARAPMPGAEPEPPDADSFVMGVEPLDTCPAAWWNWFMRSLLMVANRSALNIEDVYAELDVIMRAAGQDYTSIAGDLMKALKKLWDVDISVESQRAQLAENNLDQRITAEVNRATNAEGLLQAGIDKANDAISKEHDRATAAESQLQTNIDSEAGTRAAADTQLQHNIDDVMQIAQSGLKIPIAIALESQLPTSGQTNGDYYSIQNMNVTSPGRTGKAWWNNGAWNKIVDDFHSPDGTTIVLDANQSMSVAQTLVTTINGAAPRASPTFTGTVNVPAKTAAIAANNTNSTLPATEQQVGATRAAIESAVTTLAGRVTTLETWRSGLAASNFAITGRWTCPTPNLP